MKAFVVEKIEDKKYITSVKEIAKPALTENEVLIKTSYSSLNYKDALSSVGNPGVTKVFPHVTGIDVSGVVVESKSNIFNAGDEVLITGYDLGMNTDGGHSEFVKAPDNWVIKKPDNISLKELMIYGTAGLTAALSINELLNNGLTNGNILVTGATGGVGSISVAILSKLGFDVVALSGKEEQTDYINCKWLTRTYRIGNSVYRSTYCVASCPSQVNDKHTIYDCEWVHLYLDTQLLEYKRVGQGIKTYDLTITPDIEYDRF